MLLKILKQLSEIEREKMVQTNKFEKGIDISNKASIIRKQLDNVSKETDLVKKKKGLKIIENEIETFKNDNPAIQLPKT
jgi:hypothetical protein